MISIHFSRDVPKESCNRIMDFIDKEMRSIQGPRRSAMMPPSFAIELDEQPKFDPNNWTREELERGRAM